eukprot:TRINITY_DN45124_c0_g1_i1.p1 TRINITY_DN45124_c0_g1~~TRINITY_DN45124_c0_g1_i1.p1  ORF type:complete len:153 (+),score=38.74 TRINITY_DN45124_c0_g1_i1:44-460(+)
MSEPTLLVRRADAVVFQSSGKWLHPIFELREWLLPEGPSGQPRFPPESLAIRDKVVGRAAALLFLHTGIRQVHAVTLSKPGQAALVDAGVAPTYDSLIESVGCRTERMLADCADPAAACEILSQLREQALKKQAAQAS